MRLIAIACVGVTLIQHLTGAADAATPQTNRELLELCRIDVAECRRQAELQGKASLLAL